MSYLRSGLDTSGLNPSGVINSNFILDKVPGAVAAFSCNRVLKTSYIGQSLIRVRRSSDNVEQNIIPIGNILDSSSLNAFAGANNAYADILYNQINTNNANFIQATLANQPLIISSGNINKLNNKPALNFNGTSQYYLGQSGLLPILNNAPGGTVFCVANFTTYSTIGILYVFSTGTSASGRMAFGADLNASYLQGDFRRLDADAATYTNFTSPVNSKQYITTYVVNTPAGTSQLRANGTQVGSTTGGTTGNFIATNSQYATIGQNGTLTATNYYSGNIQELIIFPFVLNNSQIAIVEADLDRFYGVY